MFQGMLYIVSLYVPRALPWGRYNAGSGEKGGVGGGGGGDWASEPGVDAGLWGKKTSYVCPIA
jgi:hypothetical protein